MGSRGVEDHAKRILGIDYGETTKDGMVTLEPVYCLGNCACSPSVRINDDIYARVDQSRFEELIDDLQKAVKANIGAVS
jgi:formate dehydrogenase subunit gamma